MNQQKLDLWENVSKDLTATKKFKDESSIVFEGVKQVIANLAKEVVTEEVKSDIVTNVEKRVVEIFGGIPKRIEIVKEGEVREVTGNVHHMFESVLKFVERDVPVYLVGPAGSGKNVLAKQVAEAMGLPYYYTNCVTQEYKLTGYGNAAGLLVETPFYKAFTKGGVFLLDELDASIPEVLDVLNMAIANRYCDFPVVGNKQAHPDFRVIAAGNTCGEGANTMYSSRMKLDAASLDRFAIIKIDYSPELEELLSGNNKELTEYLRGVRKVAKASGIEMVVSYRAFQRMNWTEKEVGTKNAIEWCVIKCLSKDDTQIIVDGLRKLGLSNNKYTEATETLAKEMED